MTCPKVITLGSFYSTIKQPSLKAKKIVKCKERRKKFDRINSGLIFYGSYRFVLQVSDYTMEVDR
jgi:hypothetical protein